MLQVDEDVALMTRSGRRRHYQDSGPHLDSDSLRAAAEKRAAPRCAALFSAGPRPQFLPDYQST
jgi:hypothetical protein